MKTENNKERVKMENMTEAEIDRYIAERAKDATPKESLVLFLIQEKRREYEEVKALYDDMFGR